MSANKFFICTASVLMVTSSLRSGEIDWQEVRADISFPRWKDWTALHSNFRWLAGECPIRDFRLGGYSLFLEVGEATIVVLEPGESLLLYRQGRSIASREFALQESMGSRAFTRETWRSNDTHTYLSTGPGKWRSRIIRVERLRGRPGDVVSLYVARDSRSSLNAYRTCLLPSDASIEIRREHEPRGIDFKRLPAGERLSVLLRGATRIRCTTRLDYPRGESRSFQEYHLTFSDGESFEKSVSIVTSADVRQTTYVTDRATLLGETRNCYIDLPAQAEVLWIRSDAPVYLRISGDTGDSYLLPQFNDPQSRVPRGAPDSMRSSAAGSSSTGSSAWEVAASRAGEWLRGVELAGWNDADGLEGLEDAERVLRNIANDDYRKEGGLHAYWVLQGLARIFDDHPSVWRVAERVRRYFLRYRDLEPRAPGDYQGYRYFFSSRVPSEVDDNGPFIAEQIAADFGRQMSRAEFYGVPTSRREALEFKIPPSSWPTILRFAFHQADAGSQGHLEDELYRLRIDRNPSVAIRVLRSGSWPELARSTAERVFLAGRMKDGGSIGSGPGGMGNWTRGTAPLIQADTFEIEIPAGASEVKLWRQAPRIGHAWVAVQIRVSRERTLSETGYLEASEGVVRGFGLMDWFFEALVLPGEAAMSMSPAERRMAEHWKPLLRAIRSSLVQFDRVASGRLLRMKPRDVRAETASRSIAYARIAERQSQRDEALEYWSRASLRGDPDQWAEAEISKARILIQEGESYLAEGILEGVLARAGSAEIERGAFDMLRSLFANRGGGDEKVLQLDCLAVRRFESVIAMRRLVDTYCGRGDWRLALMLGLVIPEDSRPLESMIIAALHERWWQTFEELLTHLETNIERQYWRAHRNLAEGRFEEARELFLRGGVSGLEFENVLSTGLKLRARLGSDRLEERRAAVLEWLDWVASIPGGKYWRSGGASILRCEKLHRSKSTTSGRGAKFYEALPSRPVRIEVWGPVVMRVEARPIHRLHLEETSSQWPSPPEAGPLKAGPPKVGGGSEMMEGWLRIAGATGTRLVPIMRNRPSSTLHLADTRIRPGRKIVCDVRVPPGRHVFEVSALDFPVLVRTRVAVPVLNVPVLPPPSSVSVSAAIRGSLFFPEQVRGSSELTWLSCEGRTKSLTLPRLPGVAHDASVVSELDSLIDAWLPEPSADEAEYLFSAERFEEYILAPMPASAEAVGIRMHHLLYLHERMPRHRRQAFCAAERLFAENRHLPSIRSTYSRLIRGLRWRRLIGFEKSAGSRFLPVSGWQPESRAMKLRRALVPGLGDNEQIVTGTRRLVLETDSARSKLIQLSSAIEKLDLTAPAPMTVAYQVDGGSVARLYLTREQPSMQIQLALKGGAHRITVWIDAPVAHQYLRVGFLEKYEGARRIDKYSGIPLVKEVERSYQIATKAEPIVFRMDGPAWIRIDEYRGLNCRSEYHYVGSSRKSFLLSPAAGSEESLFRVFVREEGATQLAIFPESPLEYADPPTPLGGDHEALKSLEDGGEEEAWREGLQLHSWSLGGRVVRRRALEEDGQGELKPDEYFELRASHRMLLEGIATNLRTEAIGRVHVEGGPSLGLTERVLVRPDSWNGFEVVGDARLFLQYPSGSGLSFAGSSEWSGYLSGQVARPEKLGEKIYHRPSARVFGRLLSIDNGTPEAFLVTDQDVFTSYKGRHRAGVSFAESLSFYPWVDSRLAARASLTSNEDFNIFKPDNVALKLAIKQRAGNAQFDATYRVAHYFEDSNRSSASLRNIVGLRGLYDLWLRPGSRLEFLGSVALDIERFDTSFVVGLVWHWGDRSGYRDFGADSIEFIELRRQQMYSSLEDWREDGP